MKQERLTCVPNSTNRRCEQMYSPEHSNVLFETFHVATYAKRQNCTICSFGLRAWDAFPFIEWVYPPFRARNELFCCGISFVLEHGLKQCIQAEAMPLIIPNHE